MAVGCGSHRQTYVQGKVKPTVIVLGAGTPIKDVRWSSYGADTANGVGMFMVDNCVPNCAAGHVSWEPTRFRVSYIGPCKGKRSYRLISVPVRDIRDYALQDC